MGSTTYMDSNFYQRWRAAESRRKLKQRMVDYLGGSCSKCGYSKCIDAMEFHHKDPSKKDFQLSAGTYRRWDRVCSELDKCVLLCANCHRENHAEQRYVALEQQRLTARILVPERARSINLTCPVCGTSFSVCPSRLKERLTCSTVCLAKVHEKAMWPSDSDLNRLVWVSSVLVIAKSIGVSDNAVRKRCLRRGIKVPGRGYWSHLRATQRLST